LLNYNPPDFRTMNRRFHVSVQNSDTFHFFTHTFQKSVYGYIYIVILTTLFWYNQHVPELYSCTISMPWRFCCVHTTDQREKATVESINYLTFLPTELQTSTNYISPLSCSMHAFPIAQNNGCIYWITEYSLRTPK
jgi:hypothetical protein